MLISRVINIENENVNLDKGAQETGTNSVGLPTSILQRYRAFYRATSSVDQDKNGRAVKVITHDKVIASSGGDVKFNVFAPLFRLVPGTGLSF